MATLTVLLVVLAATVVAVPLADRLRLPYPILLLVFGLALAFVPSVPSLEVNPELILPLILPPLLYTAARRTSWLEFKRNWRAIGLLAVALVLVTAFVVGAVLQAILPGLPLAAALVFGAMVGPPDPVAATVVAARLRLPLAFGVIVVTLLLQGLTLPLLVRRLGIRSAPGEEAAAERELTRVALDAGRERLEQIRRTGDIPDDVIDEALEAATMLLHRLDSAPAVEGDPDVEGQRQRATRLAELEAEMLAAARGAVIAARRAPGNDPRVIDEVLGRLDARSIQPRVLPEPDQANG